MNRKILIIAILLLVNSLITNAQAPSWQWGKRGGSADVGSGGPDETVVDMATDPHGNVYVLSTVMQTSLNIDGHAVTGYGGPDMLLSSFKCDGTYRWSKDIGTNSEEVPVALKTDTLGGVYVTGALTGGSLTRYISTDTTWTSTSYQSVTLLKYDTAGNYKWLRQPQPDTITTFGEFMNPYTYVLDMDVDGGGNVYMLCNLEPGGYAGNSYIVTSESVHILKYDKNGNFICGTPMQITMVGTNASLKMKKDFQNGRYYITGSLNSGTLSFGSTPINHDMFLGCFNNTGTFLWQRQDTDPLSYYSSFGRAAVDAEHNIYVGGRASAMDTFNTYIINNGGSTALPVAFKIDTNGNNIWAKNGTVNGATFCQTITLNDDEAVIAGYYPGLLKWAGYADSLNLPAGSEYHIFITRFNAAIGAVVGIDSLVSTTGVNCTATAMTSDKFGNFYVGGDFGVSLTVAGSTLNSIGGGSDFFVAKYGTANCDTLIGTLQTPAQPLLTNTTLTVYPNPTTDELNITGVAQATSYRVYNMTGAVMQSGTLQAGDNAVSLSHLVPAIYILEMTGADGVRNIVRVVKE